MVVAVSKINGYYLACRICFILTTKYCIEGGFRGFCCDFGPNVWDKLDEQTKFFTKQLARKYKTKPEAGYQ